MVGTYKSLLNQDDFWDTYTVGTVDRPSMGLRPRFGVREDALPSSPSDARTDRRYHPRRDVTCRADYVDSGKFAGVGLITNLSHDGLFMEHAPELGVGDRVTVAFCLPGSPPFKLKGDVRWLGSHGVGVQLDGLAGGVANFAAIPEIENVRLYRSWLSQN
jgi:hypothetical protein